MGLVPITYFSEPTLRPVGFTSRVGLSITKSATMINEIPAIILEVRLSFSPNPPLQYSSQTKFFQANLTLVVSNYWEALAKTKLKNV